MLEYGLYKPQGMEPLINTPIQNFCEPLESNNGYKFSIQKNAAFYKKMESMIFDSHKLIGKNQNDVFIYPTIGTRDDKSSIRLRKKIDIVELDDLILITLLKNTHHNIYGIYIDRIDPFYTKPINQSNEIIGFSDSPIQIKKFLSHSIFSWSAYMGKKSVTYHGELYSMASHVVDYFSYIHFPFICDEVVERGELISKEKIKSGLWQWKGNKVGFVSCNEADYDMSFYHQELSNKKYSMRKSYRESPRISFLDEIFFC